MRRLLEVSMPLVALAVCLTSRPLPASACDGDCSADGVVTVDEIVRGVSIALGQAAVTNCPPFDRDGDAQVTVDEIIAAVAAALNGCPLEPTPTPGFEVTFTDMTRAAGVDYVHVAEAPLDHLTGGAAAGDYDGDGWVDLFVTRLGAPDILFRNLGDGRFSDVTQASGLATPTRRSNGAAWGDIDNDGDLDLYVTTHGPDQHRFLLFVNDGLGRFTEQAQARGAAVEGPDPHYGFSVTFGDYDLDGYVDVHTTEFRDGGDNPTAARSNTRLLRNRGAAAPGSFVDVTEAAGVAYDGIPDTEPKVRGSYALASHFTRVDDDDLPDLVVSGWYGTSRIFRNRGDGTFVMLGPEMGIADEEGSSGSAIGDFDGDGLFDWFVSAVFDPQRLCRNPSVGCAWGDSGNRLYRNLGDGTYADVSEAYGVRDGYMGWGAAFFDYDNDGDLDLTQTNGLRLPIPEFESLQQRFVADPMRLWRNDGERMTERSAVAGLTSTESGKGLLTFDYDRDGDLDVFVVNNDGHPNLYRNEGGNRQGWLRIEIEGRDSNRAALGCLAGVREVAGGPRRIREVDGSLFLGQSETTLHFGLGNGTAPLAEVLVYWPKSGRLLTLTDVPRNTTIQVSEPES